MENRNEMFRRAQPRAGNRRSERLNAFKARRTIVKFNKDAPAASAAGAGASPAALIVILHPFISTLVHPSLEPLGQIETNIIQELIHCVDTINITMVSVRVRSGTGTGASEAKALELELVHHVPAPARTVPIVLLPP